MTIARARPRDDFEAEAAVEQVAAEGAAQRVRGDVGAVVRARARGTLAFGTRYGNGTALGDYEWLSVVSTANLKTTAS